MRSHSVGQAAATEATSDQPAEADLIAQDVCLRAGAPDEWPSRAQLMAHLQDCGKNATLRV